MRRRTAAPKHRGAPLAVQSAARDAARADDARGDLGRHRFVDVKAYTADDGERLTIVRWKDLETLRQWREDPRHRAAQEAGRNLWYEFYASEVAEVLRESRFVRTSEPEDVAIL